MRVNVIGAGLAGCEAAWYLANNGVKVKLYEQKPKNKSAAHKSDNFAELVCSNSFRSNDLNNAVGVLKYEMQMFNSIVMESAYETTVKAGSALAVDRELFSQYITKKIRDHENIEVVFEEVEELEFEDITIVATGPLTSDKLSQTIKQKLGNEYFYFFDAAAPIVTKESLDMDKVYLKSRYDKGEAAYLNCPMNQEEFRTFYDFLIKAQRVDLKDFEKKVFEGCMPIEEMAIRGVKTLLFGPLKPVGLETPDGDTPHAVIQLRQDDAKETLYNIVGFQTQLKWKDQLELLKLIPGMENVEVVRYGVMHKNTYINSPRLLNQYNQLKTDQNIFFAGQITGVEGYAESSSSGIMAAVNVLRKLKGQEFVEFPKTTAMGSLNHYITNANSNNFQPMNVTFGIMQDLEVRAKKKERKELYGKRAIADMKSFIEVIND